MKTNIEQNLKLEICELGAKKVASGFFRGIACPGLFINIIGLKFFD